MVAIAPRGPAAFVQDALPGDGVVLARRVTLARALASVFRQAVTDEGADPVAERALQGAEVEAHRGVVGFRSLAVW